MDNTIVHSQEFLDKRESLLALPLLALPFIIILFIALGGGRKVSREGAVPQAGGINMQLPDAHFKKGKDKDKLGLYEETRRDSVKFREAIKNDPYYSFNPRGGSDTIISISAQLRNILQHPAAKFSQPGLTNLQSSPTNAPAEPNEQEVIKKIEQLKKVLNQKTSAGIISNKTTADPDSRKLQNIMQMINSKSGDADPEVSQLNAMLDKVMLVQHPEQMQDSMKKLAEKNRTATFAVTTALPGENITMLGSPKNEIEGQNAFYGLIDEGPAEPNAQNCIEAVIPENQSLVSGATVKLRLLQDVYAGGVKIPKDEFIYGTASLSNERLKVMINSIRYQNSIFPVSLSVYDMDGMAGIYIPGSINRDVSKESADEAVSTMGLTPVDESVGAQAAVAGIQAAKTLASRKIRLIRVTVRSGYRVLLRDANVKAEPRNAINK
jgi:conjugative transposon TraM protein